MGKQAKNNSKADEAKQKIGANYWKCPACTDKFGHDWWNRPSLCQCKQCPVKPTTKTKLFCGNFHPGLTKGGKCKEFEDVPAD